MSYILGGVQWDDNGKLEGREITPLEALESVRPFKYVSTIEKLNYDLIEKALKENENRKELMAQMGEQALKAAMTLNVIREYFDLDYPVECNVEDFSVRCNLKQIKKMPKEKWDLLMEIWK